MKKIGFTVFLFVLCLLSLSQKAQSAIEKKNDITIILPEKVIKNLIKETMPIEIPQIKKLSGTIWVQSIDKVRLGKNRVFFSLRLFGRNVKYTDKIGNVSANITLGKIDLNFDFDTTLRYDKGKQILYLKPKIISAADNDVVLTLLMEALTEESEYPVEIQKLKSFVTRIGKTQIMIKMDISNIYTLKHKLIIEIKPNVSKTDK